MILSNPKLFSLEEAVKIREQRRDRNIVLTNGCFDLLHMGHIFSLQQAAEFGELWVALNSDASIRQLKGMTRPIIVEQERAYMLAALECVSGIFIFNGQRLTHELENFHPDIYVKSADYTIETLNSNERAVLEKMGIKIQFVDLLEGCSTSKIIQKIQTLKSL
ncbi:MAG: adenylyltransferase/cytidyltransferase family protein [Puniceicoccales bacterium]|jgi:rfaE bifunctional protein nucleotidyltransferase chain/domain|nr:adenylyltransferase/cytidyltransferase family protein [Puniceicoccales bacterium]